MQLNLAGLSPCSLVNGPGRRAVVWVQGCPLGCPGCFNLHTHSPNKQLASVKELAQTIVDLPNIEGVTYSGGEPFEQAVALAKLSRIVRRRGLSVMSFSGYTLKEILSSGQPDKLRLLHQLDILIDGRLIISQKAPLRWRGSSNQLVHFLTERYVHWKPMLDAHVREVEFQLAADGQVLISGFLSMEEEIRMKSALKGYGLRVERAQSTIKALRNRL